MPDLDRRHRLLWRGVATWTTDRVELYLSEAVPRRCALRPPERAAAATIGRPTSGRAAAKSPATRSPALPILRCSGTLRPGRQGQSHQGFLHVPRRARLRRKYVAHDALAIDHERYSPWNQPKSFFYAVQLANAPAFIAQQRKRQVIFRREAAVRFGGIVADPDDFGAGYAELFEVVAEPAGLDRAPGRVVLRVEVDHHRALAAVLAE